jgi:hypothetical protein
MWCNCGISVPCARGISLDMGAKNKNQGLARSLVLNWIATSEPCFGLVEWNTSLGNMGLKIKFSNPNGLRAEGSQLRQIAVAFALSPFIGTE